MRVIRLNNGETRFIYRGNDVLEIIGENFSYELAEYMEEKLNLIDELSEEVDIINSQLDEVYEEKEELYNKIWRYESEIELLKKENERLKNPKPALIESLDDENELPFC